MSTRWTHGAFEFSAEIGPLTKVEIFDKDFEVSARGYAKYDPTDIFDPTFGFELAYARAQARLHRKIAKKLVALANEAILR